MRRVLGFMAVVMLLCCIMAIPASAGRLVLIPTADTITAGVSSEYLANTDSDEGRAVWLNIGVSGFEVEGALFSNLDGDEVQAIGGQFSLLPETSFTPGLAVGVRDATNETDSTGALYDGRSFYIIASKAVPVTGGIPGIFTDMSLHAGFGTGALSGAFLGVEGTLPMGLRLAAEYDTEDINASLGYRIIPALRAEVADIRGDLYYGASLNLSF